MQIREHQDFASYDGLTSGIIVVGPIMAQLLHANMYIVGLSANDLLF